MTPNVLLAHEAKRAFIVKDRGTRHMIFPVAELLAYIWRTITLQAGELITAGTLDGVGPIAHGDTVEVEIAGIGILRNPVRAG